MGEVALAEPRAHGLKRGAGKLRILDLGDVEATPADVLSHRAVVLLDGGDARLERKGVRVKAFGVDLAVPVSFDHPWTRRERIPLLIGENAAGAVADRAHRLPLDDSADGAGSNESDEDEQLHGWPCAQAFQLT